MTTAPVEAAIDDPQLHHVDEIEVSFMLGRTAACCAATGQRRDRWAWLRTVHEITQRNGRAPSLSEYAFGSSCSYNEARRRLFRLAELGWVDCPDEWPRIASLTREGRRQIIEYIRWQINHGQPEKANR